MQARRSAHGNSPLTGPVRQVTTGWQQLVDTQLLQASVPKLNCPVPVPMIGHVAELASGSPDDAAPPPRSPPPHRDHQRSHHRTGQLTGEGARR